MATTGEQQAGYDITTIKPDSEFAKTLAKLVIMVRPLNVIETGTYLGERDQQGPGPGPGHYSPTQL